ncbi:MAG TPA: hypothetical protein VFS54_07720 [Solirubrobacterales bacterium]|nr:hypothetical protein [Solirubrobacterales bacterium]
MRIGPRPKIALAPPGPLPPSGPTPLRWPQTTSPLRGVGDLRATYWRGTCFYASPIGAPQSEERDHADLFLDSLVRPAINELDPDMRVIRADELPTSSITTSVVEFVRQSRLVIADLSYHNPNVLYEIGLRHARGRPFVLLTRSEDPIPSNLQDARVVIVNMDKVPTFVAEMRARQEQILEYARWALSPEGEEFFGKP